MSRKVDRKVLFLVFGLVLFGVIGISVVYAALSTTLSITGSADVVASSWDVHFENAEFVSSLSCNDDYNVLPLAIWETFDTVTIVSNTEIGFVTENLKHPGDRKIIRFDVVNGGNIDAKLESTILGGLSTEQDVYTNYFVQYDDGTIPAVDDVLVSGERKTLNLVIEFDSNVAVEQLPTTKQTLNLTYMMNYVQN